MSIDAISGGAITVNGTGGSIQVRGMVNVVDNSSGAVTIVQNNVMDFRFDTVDGAISTAQSSITNIEADTNELQTDDVPGIISALNNISTAQVNAEVDTAISDASLATAAALSTAQTGITNILADTDEMQGDLANGGRLDLILDTIDSVVDAILLDSAALADDILPDSVPADGTRPTLRQAAYMVVQYLMERSVSGTTATIKKVDGSTTLMTQTLDDATSPTSVTRAT
jgi:hypothetical protein